MVFLKHSRDACYGGLQFIHSGKEYQTQVLGVFDIEGAALHQKNLFLIQYVHYQGDVIINLIYRWIEFGEHIDSAARFNTAYTWNLSEQLPCYVALLLQTTAR